MRSQLFLGALLCSASAVLASPNPNQGQVVEVADLPAVITALFTDGNNRDSRADFSIGTWNFEGFAEWPIHRVKQEGAHARCTYKGLEGGNFQISGTGSIEISPPQQITDVQCVP